MRTHGCAVAKETVWDGGTENQQNSLFKKLVFQTVWGNFLSSNSLPELFLSYLLLPAAAFLSFAKRGSQVELFLMFGCCGTKLKILFVLLLQVGVATLTGEELGFMECLGGSGCFK